jgi:shikimate 5-dehydrogenase
LNTLKPVAFLGTEAQNIVTTLYKLEAQFLPTLVPTTAKLERVVQGLEPLGFLGAVFVGGASTEAMRFVDGFSSSAERDGGLDAISVTRGTQGSHTLEDGLLATLESIKYRGFGANAVVLGGGATASAAVQIARAGVKSLTIAAPDRPHAERLAKFAPAGVMVRSISLEEPAFLEALERADLLLICDPKLRLEPRLLQPYHTLVEIAGETSLAVALERIGGQVVAHKKVRAFHLSAQLEFVTGRKLKLEGLI